MRRGCAGLVARQVHRGFAAVSSGRIDAVPYAEDVRLTVLGSHPLAADCRGLPEVERWFVGLFGALPGLRFTVHEVVVQGPPWRLRTAARYTAATSDGRVSYDGMQLAEVVRGRVVREVLLPDSAVLRDALAAHPPVAPPSTRSASPSTRNVVHSSCGTAPSER